MCKESSALGNLKGRNRVYTPTGATLKPKHSVDPPTVTGVRGVVTGPTRLHALGGVRPRTTTRKTPLGFSRVRTPKACTPLPTPRTSVVPPRGVSPSLSVGDPGPHPRHCPALRSPHSPDSLSVSPRKSLSPVFGLQTAPDLHLGQPTPTPSESPNPRVPEPHSTPVSTTDRCPTTLPSFAPVTGKWVGHSGSRTTVLDE